MSNTESRLMDNVKVACKEFNGKPEVVFVRGSVGSGLQRRNMLIMLVGPRLDLQSLAKLRAEITEALDAKEDQLKGKMGPGTPLGDFDMWTGK